MRKHSENSSNKLMGSSHDSLSKRESILSSFKEISLKECINTYDINSHKVDEASEMSTAPFRDSALAFKFSRLIDSRINTSKGNEAFVRIEVSNVAYLSKECSTSSGINTFNGSDDLEVFNHHGLAVRGKHLCNLIQSFCKVKKCRDLPFKDALFSKAYRANRGFSSLDDFIGRDGDPSTSGRRFKCLSNGFRFSYFNNPCRGKFLKEIKHGMGKDIADGLQFREGRLKDSFDFIFTGSDEVTKGFSFSGNIPEVFGVFGDRELADGIFVDKEEPSDSKGIFLIGFGFSQRELNEVGDKKGVNDDGIDTFGNKEGVKIDVVAAGGLHGSNNRGEVIAHRRDSLQEFSEARGIHICSNRETDITFRVNTSCREEIFGDIDTNEKIIHTNTSCNKMNLGKAGAASRPILHGDKGSLTQSTYHGYGRQGTNSLKGSMTQELWSSPAYPILMYMGKAHSYKLYNTNS